jgi:hypothetical protein
MQHNPGQRDGTALEINSAEASKMVAAFVPATACTVYVSVSRLVIIFVMLIACHSSTHPIYLRNRNCGQGLEILRVERDFLPM